VKLRIGIIGILIVFGSLDASSQVSFWESENQAGMRAFQQGQYEIAESLFQDSLRQVAEFGPLDPRFLSTLFNLAETLAAEGRYSKAESLLQWSLALRENVFGPIHPEVARVLNALGVVYEKQGNYAEAEAVEKRALDVSKEINEPDHQNLVMALFNLAILYKNEGRYSEADSLLNQILSIPEYFHGRERLDRAIFLNRFGDCVFCQTQV